MLLLKFSSVTDRSPTTTPAEFSAKLKLVKLMVVTTFKVKV